MSVENILVVDDNEDLLKMVEVFLNEPGFKVVTATGGNQALQIYKKLSPKIIVTDIEMPNGNGIALLQQIRLISKDAFIVVISGGKHHERSQLLKLGADDFLEKPFSKQKLVSVVIEKFVQRRKAQLPK